jgi:uncharacterized Tic20 family protein
MVNEDTTKPSVDRQAQIWGMACHLSALVAMTGLPLGHIFGPLIVWLIKKKTHHFIYEQGKESLNFQLSMTLYTLVIAPLIYIKIGMVLIFVLVVINFILVIIASLRAYQGEIFQYPFKIRFIK